MLKCFIKELLTNITNFLYKSNRKYNKLICLVSHFGNMKSNFPAQRDQNSREARRNELRQENRLQPGIAFPSASDQEHLLIIRLDITGSPFTKDVDQARTIVQEGLKRLCQLFDRISCGKKRIDELDKHGMIVSQKLADRFNFSATIGFGASFFEQLDIPVKKRPKKLREMPDYEELGDVAPYSLGQTDLIIQLGSTKDFVNRWVLENSLQPDDDEAIEKLLKKQRAGTLNSETEKKILKGLLENTTPEGVALNDDERCCADGQVLSSDEEECIPDIVSAIQGWATITDVHAGFQRIDGRNLMGFNDGVSNPKPDDDNGIFEKVVLTTKYDEENEELTRGTYMVFQKIEHDLDQWRELSLDEQQEWVGRSKGTGLLLGTLDEDEDERLALNLRSNNEDVRSEAAFDIKQLLKIQMNPATRFFDGNGNTIEVQGKRKKYKIHPNKIREKVPAWSHVRKANPRKEDGVPPIIIFRRGYPFVETGLNNKIRSGLLFVSFQKDIQNGFEYIKKKFFNNKNFPVPEFRDFTEDELKERHKSGRLSGAKLNNLTAEERKALGLDDDDELNKALEEAGVVKPNIDKNYTSRNIDKNDLSLVPDTQNTGREGLAGPSEHGVIPTGEFLAAVPLGGGYYFIPPIPNKSIKDIGQQFFE
jgi:Dyp-type peroxidase family